MHLATVEIATKLQLYIQISRNFNPSESKMSAEVIIFCASNWKLWSKASIARMFSITREKKHVESTRIAEFQRSTQSLPNPNSSPTSNPILNPSFLVRVFKIQTIEPSPDNSLRDIDSHGSDVVLIPKTFLQNLDRQYNGVPW